MFLNHDDDIRPAIQHKNKDIVFHVNSEKTMAEQMKENESSGTYDK